MFGRRRGVLLFVLPLVLVGLSVLVRALVGEDVTSAGDTLYGLGLAVIVPLVALIATTGVLAPEIDDGSISYLLAKPISRHVIVVSKLLVAGGCVLVFGAVPMLISGLVMAPGTPEVGARLRARRAGRRAGVLRAVLAAVGADPPCRGDRARLPADLGGPARRAARRGPVAQHHPLGRGDHRRGRRPLAGDATSA